jgi:ABC-2 type transport system ATP-binding protein
VSLAGESGSVSLGEKTAVPDLVERLVQGGVRISVVEPHRRNLEEIYLTITHETGSAT